MPLKDQLQAIVDAEIIAGPHGAGLTNILFADPSAKILELHPDDEVNYCFWLTAGGMKLRYALLSGTRANAQRDMVIDPVRLQGMLKKLM